MERYHEDYVNNNGLINDAGGQGSHSNMPTQITAQSVCDIHSSQVTIDLSFHSLEGGCSVDKEKCVAANIGPQTSTQVN